MNAKMRLLAGLTLSASSMFVSGYAYASPAVVTSIFSASPTTFAAGGSTTLTFDILWAWDTATPSIAHKIDSVNLQFVSDDSPVGNLGPLSVADATLESGTIAGTDTAITELKFTTTLEYDIPSVNDPINYPNGYGVSAIATLGYSQAFSMGSDNQPVYIPDYTYDPSNGGIYLQSDDGTPQFLTVTAVPEPESYAMLLAGISLLGFMAHRRKQKDA